MKTNLNKTDRTIRFATAMVLVTMFLINVAPFHVGLMLLSMAGPFLLTAFVGFCPFYALLNKNFERNQN